MKKSIHYPDGIEMLKSSKIEARVSLDRQPVKIPGPSPIDSPQDTRDLTFDNRSKPLTTSNPEQPQKSSKQSKSPHNINPSKISKLAKNLKNAKLPKSLKKVKNPKIALNLQKSPLFAGKPAGESFVKVICVIFKILIANHKDRTISDPE